MKRIAIIILLVVNHHLLIGQSPKKYFFKTDNVKEVTIGFDKGYGNLPLDMIPNPFEFGAPIGKNFEFFLANDTLSFRLKDEFQINIVRTAKNDTIVINIKPIRVVTFDDTFKKKNEGKVDIAIPEVYELMNVLIALTPNGLKDEDLIYQNSDYFKSVQSYFEKYSTHPAVNTINTLLGKGQYNLIKMDAYSFVFGEGNKIVGSENYHVINWNNVNSISPALVKEMEDFVIKSGFRNFYHQNNTFYKDQISFFQNDANLSKMIGWLRKNFPTTYHNYFNIIFSPLVYANQSTQTFSDNNFKESQAHVNFPYADKEIERLIPKSYKLYRGRIVFTELNHNFINPEADKYKKIINANLSDLSVWEEKGKAAQLGYPIPMLCFEEYLNWGLVTLYLHDHADASEAEKINELIEQKMQDYRGFIKFKAFNQFLLSLYKSNDSKAAIADLYPTIINWFAQK